VDGLEDDLEGAVHDGVDIFGIQALGHRREAGDVGEEHRHLFALALDGALESLAKTYPRKSEVVELKFFGGLETREISEVLQVSEKTVLRDWNFAKLWLCRELNEHAA